MLRRHRQSWLGLIAALALALAACGGDDRPDPAAFDPDAHDLTQLVIWERSDSLILVRQNLPAAQQELIDRLLASELPGLDKYVVDLAAFPNPYRLQVIDYLRARYRTPPYTIVFNYPQIFDFHPADSDTDAYIAFKRALFGALYPRMAAMMDPGAPRLIDAREVLWGGVEVDGIPALEFPAQVSVQEAAAWINDSDPVIGVAINGDVRAYPIRIIAWHEMVNDTVGGLPVSLAYCTLCGAPILYDGRAGDAVYRFGTSGLLYRSNKLMYDRTTETLWNQFSGEPVWGPLAGRGIRLTPLPAVHTTWGEWRRAHPGSTVLDIETGFRRDYGPGVAYADYNASPDPLFYVPIQDDRPAPQGGGLRRAAAQRRRGVPRGPAGRVGPHPGARRRRRPRRRRHGRRPGRPRVRLGRRALHRRRSGRRHAHRRRRGRLAPGRGRTARPRRSPVAAPQRASGLLVRDRESRPAGRALRGLAAR